MLLMEETLYFDSCFVIRGADAYFKDFLMPPPHFEEEGGILLCKCRSVRRSVGWSVLRQTLSDQ